MPVEVMIRERASKGEMLDGSVDQARMMAE
jgi:hypothetical protein